ncbi:MAG: NAD(P)-dependent alcohol dehydrogenase [Vicinamibacterales bacterium]|jgi:NADPH:quinone reductase-like Zn-dependent oxidoreductase|nr:NAD(P)-dependent alcohol dehydrogenase [Vicinamibacterales bacterium]
MNAIVWTAYGSPDLLQVREIETPVPGPGELLVRVHAATVLAGDCELRRAEFPALYWLPIRLMMGITRPRDKVLGQEFSGMVETVGEGVTRFEPGDEILGTTGFRMGAWAEFVCLPASYPLVKKPAGMSHAEAAALPVGGSNALHFLEKAGSLEGKRVLVAGSTGSIGTFGVQLARYFGAEVTAVCGTKNIQLVKALGASRVIDYQNEDFTDEGIENGGGFDVIFETIGKVPMARCARVLRPGGTLLLANPSAWEMIGGLRSAMGGGRRVVTATAHTTSEQLEVLTDLVDAGTIRIVLDRRWPLEQMAEAHRYVDLGEKTGGVVIEVVRQTA